MSVDQLPRRSPRPADDAKLVQYDEYIDAQIRSTRRAVKAVDFATALVTLSAGLLAFLLTVAVVEHWLLPGGFNTFGRTILFVVLAGGAGYFAYRKIWPLVLHSINPIYAAHTIEHSSPTLKNSLINLLLFRQRPGEVSEAVYKTLEEQAAQRLTRVPVDAAVDRTQLIRFGYVLLAVVALAALYKVLSPKDPLVTAERVLRPWADIVPASRVQISAVEPGHVTIARGELLDVSAVVRGLGEADSVTLRYTTADGQAVGKAVPMRTGDDGERFTSRLPDGADSAGAVGVAQNLTYRIEAGDARSLDYRVTVVPAPTILVQRVDYEYPEYTGYQNRSVEEMGDIRAIEGTRVTIHARANGPIDEAFIDFEVDGRRDLRMSSRGTRASAEFVLALREDRQTPRHSSYVVRFTNRDGRTNRNPVKHPIDVVPDYSPEVAILAPEEETRDVRLDETVAIEVEARDPDFALSEVRLRGEAPGRPAIDEPLLEQEHTGRFRTRYQFTPNEHSLRAGDVLKIWVVANDNRTPKPNTTATERKTFRIVAPDPDQQPPPDHIAQHDQRQQPDQPPQEQPQDGEQQQQDGEQQPQDGEQQPGGQQEVSRDGQPGEQDGEQRPGESAPQNGRGEQQPDDSQELSRDAEGSANGQQREDTSDGQDGTGAADGERSQDGVRRDGQRGADDGSFSRDAEQSAEESQREPSPISSEGDNDAEAFERIRRHLQQRGELGEEDSPESASPDRPDGEQPPGHDAERSRDDEAFGRDAERSTDEEREQAGDPAATDEQERDASRPDGDPRTADARESQQPDAESEDHRGERPADETRPDGADPSDGERGPGDAREQEHVKEQDASRVGEQTTREGEPGTGEESDERGDVADSQETTPTDDRQQRRSSTDAQPDDSEPPASAQPGRESDTEGEHGADRPGAGDEGSDGQQAPREGTGSAGEHEPADEGAGESREHGPGAESADPGSDAASDQRTGEPGSDPGEGGTPRDGESAPADGEQQPGGDQDPFSRDAERSEDDPRGQPGEPAPADGQRPGDADPSPADGTQPGTPTGDPAPRTDPIQPRSSDATAPEGDEANLEYARKQTDLVLEKLSDQLNRKQVDEELLEGLGWSEEELQQFVARWQERKAQARSNNPAADAARRELDEALRSLGLRPGELQQSQVREDDQRDFSEGYRDRVPLQYRERARIYSESISRSRQQAE